MQRNHHVSILLSADDDWHFILKNCFPSLLCFFPPFLPSIASHISGSSVTGQRVWALLADLGLEFWHGPLPAV